MLVAPASSKEAVTHDSLGKQRKEECQDNYKQELSNPQPHVSARNSAPAPPCITYLSAVTVFTAMVVPSAVPVTFACSQASLLRVSRVA